MPKSTKRQNVTRAKVGAVERAAIAEKITLRRLVGQQRAIVDLSKRLTRAVRKADGARLDAARELCADTGFCVVDAAGLAETTRTIDNLREQLDSMIARAAELEAQLTTAAV